MASRTGTLISYTPNNFNATSGQCFAELTVRARRKRNLSLLSSVDRPIYKNAEGPCTLESIALRQFLTYMEDVTPDMMDELVEYISCLPWTIGCRVWTEAQKMETLQSPLTVWRAFLKAYPQQEGIVYHCASINRPEPEDLPIYLKRMNSDSLDWLTSLTINDHSPLVAFQRSDIINISALKNLVALDIGSSATLLKYHNIVDDSIIRAWGRHAQEIGSFPRLQLLVIRDQPNVTTTSLDYLNDFPTLVLFGVQNCFPKIGNKEKHALEMGWTCHDEFDVLKEMERSMKLAHTWDEPIHACFKASSALLPQPLETKPAVPFLNFRLGPVPSGVLFATSNMVSRPLVFFRSLRFTPRVAANVVPLMSNSASQAMEIPQPPLAKRPKLRNSLGAQTALMEEFFPGHSRSKTVAPGTSEGAETTSAMSSRPKKEETTETTSTTSGRPGNEETAYERSKSCRPELPTKIPVPTSSKSSRRHK